MPYTVTTPNGSQSHAATAAAAITPDTITASHE